MWWASSWKKILKLKILQSWFFPFLLTVLDSFAESMRCYVQKLYYDDFNYMKLSIIRREKLLSPSQSFWMRNKIQNLGVKVFMIIMKIDWVFFKQKLRLIINFMIADVIYWAIKNNLIFQIIDAIEINRTMFNVTVLDQMNDIHKWKNVD